MNSCKNSCLAIISIIIIWGQAISAQAHESLETDDQKTLYTFGYAVAREWRKFGFSESEIEIITEAMKDSVLQRKPQTEMEKWVGEIQPVLAEKQNAAKAATIKRQTALSAAFLKQEAEAPGAKTTSSGLIITELKSGTGLSPKATDKVTVHYQGTLMDSTVFDSSTERGQPATFPLSGVIKCWTEGLQLMKVGGKSRLVCPAELAYGNNGAGSDIPPAAALIFEVELLKVE